MPGGHCTGSAGWFSTLALAAQYVPPASQESCQRLPGKNVSCVSRSQSRPRPPYRRPAVLAIVRSKRRPSGIQQGAKIRRPRAVAFIGLWPKNAIRAKPLHPQHRRILRCLFGVPSSPTRVCMRSWLGFPFGPFLPGAPEGWVARPSRTGNLPRSRKRTPTHRRGRGRRWDFRRTQIRFKDAFFPAWLPGRALPRRLPGSRKGLAPGPGCQC